MVVLLRTFVLIHRKKKGSRLYILTQYLANQTKPTRHTERYGLMAVIPTLTALLLSSLNDLQYFFVFLYALLEFSCAKHYRLMYQSPSFSLRWIVSAHP